MVCVAFCCHRRTGVVEVIVALPLLKVNELAGVPFTVKSLGWTVAGCTGPLRLITKSVSWVNTTLPQAGSEVITVDPRRGSICRQYL